MAEQSWMDDEALSGIDRQKLQFLQKLVFETKGLSQKEMMPFLMALAGKARASDISFTETEVSTIITVLKKHSTPEELSKMDRVLKMSNFMGKK